MWNHIMDYPLPSIFHMFHNLPDPVPLPNCVTSFMNDPQAVLFLDNQLYMPQAWFKTGI